MDIFCIALPGSEIPESMAFKIAFVIVTALYVITMIVLFSLYKKSVKNIPSPKDKDKDSNDNDEDVMNR